MVTNNEFKIVVLYGGIGSERGISIQSGKAITKALTDVGADVICSDIKPDNLAILDEPNVDVFFLALHGAFGEDGQIQRILENRKLTYTASGSTASEMAFDKIASKKAFKKAKLNVPKAICFESVADFDTDSIERISVIGNRFVVKPKNSGSSVGIEILETPSKAVDAAKKCVEEFGNAMVEELIEGREFTVGLLGERTLPIIEIKAAMNFYDYNAKYVSDKTQFLFDTTDGAVAGEMNDAAVIAFNCLGCENVARVDFILTDDNKIYVLELNTIPGFTSHSLLPMAAKKIGLSLGELCMAIAEDAVRQAKMDR